jgi:hypothetical protein
MRWWLSSAVQDYLDRQLCHGDNNSEFNLDSPDGSACILLDAPDLVAASAAYANRQDPIAVGAAGESKANLLLRRKPPKTQASELLRETPTQGEPEAAPS